MTNTNASFGTEVQRQQKTENPRVGGSIPPLGTINFQYRSCTCDGQFVKSNLAIVDPGVILGVTRASLAKTRAGESNSSSPIARSNFLDSQKTPYFIDFYSMRFCGYVAP